MLGTSKHFAKKILASLTDLFGARPRLDSETAERMEERMMAADMGVDQVTAILGDIEKMKLMKGEVSWEGVLDIIRVGLARRVKEALSGQSLRPIPRITLLFGVNGSGKTTTAAKLAWKLLKEKRTPVLVAADTFRAAAREQLSYWGRSMGADVWNEPESKDPASVVYNALAAYQGRENVSLVIDTAGRLQSKTHLMEELKKIRRVIAKTAPQENILSLLVMDATTGQNGLSQAREFHEAVNMDGIILSKYDTTAKGGIALSVMTRMKKAVYFLGVGEKPEDLWPFELDRFLNEIF